MSSESMLREMEERDDTQKLRDEIKRLAQELSDTQFELQERSTALQSTKELWHETAMRLREALRDSRDAEIQLPQQRKDRLMKAGDRVGATIRASLRNAAGHEVSWLEMGWADMPYEKVVAEVQPVVMETMTGLGERLHKEQGLPRAKVKRGGGD